MIDVNKIEKLVEEEYIEACGMYPMFHSGHEAHNVIREELEESEHELQMCKIALERMWAQVKNDDDYVGTVEDLKYRSLKLIQEAIQVSAMCDKAINSVRTK